MDAVEMELYAVDGNVAVVRLPTRRFPGVLIQGDTMNMIRGMVREAARERDPSEKAAIIGEVLELLDGVLTTYEAALGRAGVQLPYTADGGDRGGS